MDYIDNCPIGKYTCTGCNYLSTCGCNHPNKYKQKENFIEIPFGARDSETLGWEYTIPDDMEATIKDGKIIVRKKESGDEKMLREIKRYIKEQGDKPTGLPNGNVSVSDMLIWLEKQGEQKPTIDIQNLTWEDIEKIGDFINMVQSEYPNGIGAKCLYTDVLERFLDGKGISIKQKPVENNYPAYNPDEYESFENGNATGLRKKQINNTDEDIVEAIKDTSVLDMIEPKFKEGDWVVCEITGSAYQIENCIENPNNHKYGYLINGGYISSGEVNHYHLWTIQDAKDGDVLAIEPIDVDYPYPFVAIYKERGLDYFNSYCNVGFNGTFYINEFGHYINVHPATKEQRDLLFQKMKETGYEWDADKKELKKVEQNMELTDFESALFTTFSDAWQQYLGGEEVNVAQWAKKHSTELLEVARKEHVEWSKEDKSMIEWLIYTAIPSIQCDTSWKRKVLTRLKSLKPQSHWKPSDRQMQALEYHLHSTNNESWQYKETLKLYNDLKKII